MSDNGAGRYIQTTYAYAMQLAHADDIRAAAEWITGNGGSCTWITSTDALMVSRAGEGANRLIIHSLGQPVIGVIGDWVVRGSDGLFTVVRPGVFAATYRPVDAEDAAS